MPDVPPEVESSVYPVPQFSWMQRFEANLRLTKSGPFDVIFDGDSITDGWRDPGRKVWARHFGKLRAANFGISGDRTDHLLWRLENGQAAGLHPKVVVIMIGTNNLRRDADEEVADGIKAVVATYQKVCPEAQVLVLGIFPRASQPDDPLRARVKAINRLLAGTVPNAKTIFADIGEKFLKPDGTLSPDIMSDFLHPTARGYEIWAEALQPYLDRMLSVTAGH